MGRGSTRPERSGHKNVGGDNDLLAHAGHSVGRSRRPSRTLSPGESERVIGFARLIQESGNPEGFGAIAWMSRWLNDPIPALGGARPIDLMDTMEG
jgi:uncharacterized protein (DUF2384 family)